MKSKKTWVIALIFVIGVVAVIFLVRAGQTTSTAGWDASGFIEADVFPIAPEMGGRVSARPFSEGAEVKQGDVVLKVADDILAAQVDLARGKLDEATALLAQVKAGARPGAIAQAEAQLALAQAGRDAANQAWQDAQAIRHDPQMLDVQIAAAKAQVAATQKQFEAALLQRDIAEKAWKDYGKISDKLAGVPPAYRPSLPLSYYDIPYQWEQAVAGVNVAQANYDAAVAALKNLQNQRADPQEAQTQVDAAYAKFQAAEAQVAQAQAALAGLQAGAIQEQIDAAQAQVNVAQAALDAAQTQLDKTIVRAPANGVIATTSVYTGELAVPSVTALKLADLDRVTLTIFVPGGEVGQFSIGQSINVRIDAFPDRVFTGSVVYLSDQAEFTPRSVRTPDERVKLVYALKIRLDNPDHVLKPGLQAEAEVGN